MTFWKCPIPFVDQKQQNQQNGTTESTKWEYLSTKWATKTAKGGRETTKWDFKKQQSGQQILYRVIFSSASHLSLVT